MGGFEQLEDSITSNTECGQQPGTFGILVS